MMALGIPHIQPVLLIHVATELRASSYKIWSVLKIDAGIEVRAEHGTRQIRLIVPRPGTKSVSDVTTDRIAHSHIVHTLAELRNWLRVLDLSDSITA
ncbi:hypothetical protein GCM10028773_58290 [Spirosoma koreense]